MRCLAAASLEIIEIRFKQQAAQVVLTMEKIHMMFIWIPQDF